MKISFIIPAYNEEQTLRKCLESIMSTLATTHHATEVIVVNNASTDHTREVAKSFSTVRIVDEPKKGLVWARRAGYLASTGDLLANIDADTILPPAWLPTVIKEFSSDPTLLALSGPYIYYDAPWLTRVFVKIFYAGGLLVDVINQFFFKSGSMLQGGNFVLRRDALEKIGGFNTSIEFYGEDTDIGRRIRKIGKAKWTFKLPMLSSGRRFMKQGLLTTGIIYSLNFIWVNVCGKPFSKKHIDIRL